MQNNLCTNCDGRGFHWLKGGIRAHDSKLIIADTYKHGPQCSTCNGSGRAQQPVSCGSIALGFVLLFVFFAFVSNPIAHLISG